MLFRFVQTRNYTLKQIMESSLIKGARKTPPKPTPKANANAISKCCLLTCPQINGSKLHYKPSVPLSSLVCVFRPPKI